MLRIVLSIFIPQHGVNSSEFHCILLSIPSIFSTALSNAICGIGMVWGRIRFVEIRSDAQKEERSPLGIPPCCRGTE